MADPRGVPHRGLSRCTDLGAEMGGWLAVATRCLLSKRESARQSARYWQATLPSLRLGRRRAPANARPRPTHDNGP